MTIKNTSRCCQLPFGGNPFPLPPLRTADVALFSDVTHMQSLRQPPKHIISTRCSRTATWACSHPSLSPGSGPLGSSTDPVGVSGSLQGTFVLPLLGRAISKSGHLAWISVPIHKFYWLFMCSAPTAQPYTVALYKHYPPATKHWVAPNELFFWNQDSPFLLECIHSWGDVHQWGWGVEMHILCFLKHQIFLPKCSTLSSKMWPPVQEMRSD